MGMFVSGLMERVKGRLTVVFAVQVLGSGSMRMPSGSIVAGWFRANSPWVAFASAWCPICVVTDSQYCVTLWTRLTEDSSQSTSHWDHSDVWLRLQDLLLQSQDMEDRPFFVVHKTLGHGDELDPDAYQAAVAAGLTSPVDSRGNHHADRLAVAGARLHALEESEVASHHSYARRVAFGQALMLKIWLSRVALLGDLDDSVGPFLTSSPAPAADAPVPPAPHSLTHRKPPRHSVVE